MHSHDPDDGREPEGSPALITYSELNSYYDEWIIDRVARELPACAHPVTGEPCWYADDFADRASLVLRDGRRPRP